MGRVIFPALLFVLLDSTVRRLADAMIKLDMFPELVDYSSCRDEMLQIVIKPGGLLEKELNNNPKFQLMWKANAKCGKEIPGATQEHMAALQSYADADYKFHELFNTELYRKGKNIKTYQDAFHFKSLYFLLSDALQLLKKDTCQAVYFGSSNKYNITLGDSIRFGTFLSAKLKYDDLVEEIVDVGGTIFNITSCSVVNLESLCNSEEIELLISPTESFKVEKIRISVNEDEETITQVTLAQHALKSSFDCKSLFSSSSESEKSSLMNLMAAFVMVFLCTLDL